MSHILSIAFVFLHTVAFSWVCFVSASAQLSGAVDLGGGTSEASSGSSEQNTKSAKQILVTGIGATPESAEKQAITDAVRQAVGAYVDTNTIVENEAIIKDRILSVSNGFVKEYKVVSPAKQRDDGLYELQILATVQTGQVVQALKENNLISGEVAGANMWAEASTKVMNAQDAVAMLQAKMPELIKSSVTITPLGEDGKPMLFKDGMPNTSPASVNENAATGEAHLQWRFRLDINKDYYDETFLPVVRLCLDAAMGVPSQRVQISLEKWLAERDDYILRPKAHAGFPAQIRQFVANAGRVFDMGLLLVENVSKNFDSLHGVCYPAPKRRISIRNSQSFPDSTPALAELRVQLHGDSGELLAESKIPAWTPFSADMWGLAMIGPYVRCNNNGELYLKNPLVQEVELRLPLDLLKEIKQVRVDLVPLEVHLALEEARQ